MREKTMSIEAMKAIRMVYANTTKHDWPDDIWDAICQAIEAEKQEPVAWCRYEDGMWVYYETKAWDDLQPLYTHPQPKREWVGLTEQDKEDTMEWLGHDVSSQVFYAIEAKLKEKNA
jgi:hypothetical protein